MPQANNAQEQSTEASPREQEAETTRRVGRGFLIITAAKLWFVISASVLNFGLPLLFSNAADYGAYGVVINVASLLNMVMITGTLQAVSKLVSERSSSVAALAKRAVLLQTVIALPIAVIYFFSAHAIADWLNDPSYVPLLQISSVIVLSYAYYAVFVGCFNGMAAFRQQASLDMLFATLRVILVLAGVAVGLGVAGAVGGFAVAAVGILLISVFWLYRHLRQYDETASGKVDARRLGLFLLSTLLYTFLLNTVMRIDLFMLKRISGAIEGFEQSSNALSGAYNLVLNVARVPYQAVIAIAFVIFPLLSQSTFEQDREATRSYVSNTMRYTLFIVFGFVAALAGGGADVLRPIYPDYAYATVILLPVMLAYAFFATSYVASTMLIAAGRPGLASAICALMGLSMALGCSLTLEPGQAPMDMLWATAYSVLISMSLGMAAVYAAMRWRFGAFAPWRSVLRIATVSAVVLALGALTSFSQLFGYTDVWPGSLELGVGTVSKDFYGSRLLTLAIAAAKATGLGLLYLIGLWASREFGPEDWNRLRRVFKKRG
ncbi:MAG: oligosaccharide flippase family protein [Myxococcota bacterium]|jgi:O-antigen/teichoic acid export membrane protein|nr:oligosaccharide flippase family protein [Myxococcota bacterium]